MVVDLHRRRRMADRVFLVVKPTEAGTIFQASNDSRCSNQSTHVQWAHDEADLLCSSEGHSGPCIGLFSLGSLFLRWELVEAFPSCTANPSWVDEPAAPADIRRQWQEAQANRRMQFKVGDYKGSKVRMLTGTLKADWIQLPVERYLAVLSTLKQGVIAGVFTIKGASPWAIKSTFTG